MPFDPRSLLQPFDLRDLPRKQVHLLLALRLCTICRKNGGDPVELMAVRFGSITAAKAMLSLAGAMGEAWPDAFMISRPCCTMVTPDERLAAQLMMAVENSNHRRFAVACAEMFDESARDRIYRAMARFSAELDQVLATRA